MVSSIMTVVQTDDPFLDQASYRYKVDELIDRIERIIARLDTFVRFNDKERQLLDYVRFKCAESPELQHLLL